MRQYLTSIFIVFISLSGFGQITSNHILDVNNAHAIVNDAGVFFHDPSSSEPGNEVPAGSQLHTIYSLGFWFGGVDVNGQLKMSPQMYAPHENQFKGPLSADGALNFYTSVHQKWLFSIKKEDIDYHLANYMNPGYNVSSAIGSWPAHGDVSGGYDYYLAPFVDTDGDGVYDPYQGDYPCIKGDQAVFVVMNDKSQGIGYQNPDHMGLELHFMFYEYTGIPEIENTTFIDLKVINRSTQTYNDFKVSTFVDGDIGFSGDDFFGSDSSRNLMFFYNGDNSDEAGANSSGYGTAPPAAGIISLNNNYESIGNFSSPAPNSLMEYWNLMNAKNINGSSWLNPVTGLPTDFTFSSDPTSPSEMHSEVALQNTPGERRGIATIDVGTLEPSSEHVFSYAVVSDKSGQDNISNVQTLKSAADIVQDFYEVFSLDGCTNATAGTDEIPNVNFSVHPNPSNGQFNIVLGDNFANAQVEILDLSGRVVLDQLKLTLKETIISLDQPSGVYLLRMTLDGQSSVKRIIVE